MAGQRDNFLSFPTFNPMLDLSTSGPEKNTKHTLIALSGNVKFWIILFFFLRLYGITFPPLEVGHNIRQTDGLMIARNFYERDPNIFYPMVDVAGEKSGIVGCEFPLLNYSIYLMSLVFGFENWFGRLINLIVSSLGVFWFHEIILKYFGDRTALFSSVILLVSLWFTYSRKTIPDTFALSLVLGSLYHALRYLDKGKLSDILGYILLGTLGCLSKISAGAFLSVLALPILFSPVSNRSKLIFCGVSLIILVPTFWWYFEWVPHLNDTYEYKMFFMGMPISEGFKQIMDDWPIALKRFYDTPLKYSGFLLFVFGLMSAIKNGNKLLLAAFFLPFLFYLVVILKSGINFIGNEYYMLALCPPLALVAGYGLTAIPFKWLATTILIIVSAEGIGNKVHDFRIREPFASFTKLEEVFDSFSERGERIAINGAAESGTVMFFTHRRGWRVLNHLLEDESYMAYLRENDCKYVLIVTQHPWININLELPVVYEEAPFKVYKLQ